MAQETYSRALGSARAASTAGGGTALTTTAGLIQLPDGADYLTIVGRNYSTAVVVKFALNPYLVVAFTQDAGVTWLDASVSAQDGKTSTAITLNSWDTLANGDSLWLGSHVPFRGISVDVQNANGNAAVLAAHYWNGALTAVSGLSDGTISTGFSFAVDGIITWTLPTDWVTGKLSTIYGTGARGAPMANAELFWLRLSQSAALDSTVSVNSILALNAQAVYGELITGQVLEFGTHKGVGGIGCIEALTDAGTANLIVNCYTGLAKPFGV